MHHARHVFINRLRILHSLDHEELPPIAPADWQKFMQGPSQFLIRADDATANAIMAAIERREG